MRILFTICFMAIISVSFSQNSQQIRKHNISFSGVIGINEILNFEDVEIQFKKVLIDSRCPKSVMCIRAGEAEVLVSIFRKGEFIKDIKLITTHMGSIQKANLVFTGEDFEIYGLALKPYPLTPDSIKSEDYALELVMKEVN